MLVLTRKPGETICIGTDVTLTVLDVKGCRVSLGIEAPHRVLILRGELADFPPAGAAPNELPAQLPSSCAPRR